MTIRSGNIMETAYITINCNGKFHEIFGIIPNVPKFVEELNELVEAQTNE